MLTTRGGGMGRGRGDAHPEANSHRHLDNQDASAFTDREGAV